MKTALLFKKHQFFTVKYETILALGIFLLISVPMHAQQAEIIVPASQVKLKSIKINSGRVESPADIDPNAIYSNVSAAFAGNAYSNGGAALQAGNTITTLVADSLGLIGTPPFTVTSFVFSVTNLNAVDVLARPRVRFYANDGPGGSPGTFITGITFDPPILFSASTYGLLSTGPLLTTFDIATKAIWAGITFDDNVGATGATAEQLNNLGQEILNPIDRGSSGVDFFQTTSAGSFFADSPIGGDFALSDLTPANFAWEIVASAPVPVTLSNFNAQRNGQINTLIWNTSQELNTNYFAVERSIDGIHFNQIGKVKAGGNSSVARSYHFDDGKPVKGINYYRLHMVDIDNAGKYSTIVTVKNTGLVNLTIYPNPVKNSMLVNIDAEKAGMAEVRITDINGRKVYNRHVTLTQGNNNFSVDVNNFSKGTYFIKVQLSTGSFTNKFDKL